MFVILASIVYIACVTFICHALRVVTRATMTGVPKLMVEEFVSTAEFCIVCYELALVCDTHGKTMYAIGLYVMCLWWGSNWGDAAVNPNKYIEDFVRGDSDPKQAGMLIGIEAASGLIVWRIVRLLWAYGLSELHYQRSGATTCDADLQVTVAKGAAVECLLTFIDRANALSQEHYSWQYSNVFNAILSTGLVVAALDYSGGYFNPVLAMSLKMGCRGHSIPEHVFVYIVASIAGSMMALQCYKFVVRMTGLKKQVVVTDDKKSR